MTSHDSTILPYAKGAQRYVHARKWIVLTLVLLIGIVVALIQAARTTPAVSATEEAILVRVARELATAFGQGELYRTPDKYPTTQRLRASIAKLPNRGHAWPPFVSRPGEVVVVLNGREANGQAFTDVVAHVLSQGANGSAQLTQVDLRLVHEGETWKADRVFTLAKGSVQP